MKAGALTPASLRIWTSLGDSKNSFAALTEVHAEKCTIRLASCSYFSTW